MQPPWEWTALTNPYVKLWWQQMQMQEPRLKNVDMLSLMRKQKQMQIYDYAKALNAGSVPYYQPEHGQWRWNDMGKMANNPNLDNKQ